MVSILNKSETNLADQSYSDFLENEINGLTEFMVVWTIAVIVLIGAIGYAISDYLFSAFKYIKDKSR